MPAAPVTVRRATPKDAAAFVQTMGDPEVLPNLLQVPHTSEEIWQQRLADNVTPGKPDIVLVAELDGRVVGNAGLHPIANVRRRHAAGLGIAVAREAQGQGVGAALMQALCDYADHWAQLLRIELNVFIDNERAIRLYERFGFQHEGTHRGYALRSGRYVDVHSMARLHPNPPSIR